MECKMLLGFDIWFIIMTIGIIIDVILYLHHTGFF